MAIPKVLQTQIEARLLSGETPVEVANAYDGVGYGTVNKINNDLKAIRKDVAVDELSKSSPKAIEAVAELVHDNGFEDMAGELQELSENVKSMQKLEIKMHSGATTLIEAVMTKAMDPDLSVSDLTLMMDSLGVLYERFFKVEKGVNITMMQNNANLGANSLSEFKDIIQ